MEKENNPIYERNTLEFVTVALEFCTFVETAGQNGLSSGEGAFRTGAAHGNCQSPGASQGRQAGAGGSDEQE